MSKRVLIIVLVVITIALGFLRDYIFVSLNSFIEAGSDAGGKLALLKWVLTALFSLLYLLLACTFIQVLFKEKKYIFIALLCYALLFAVAFMSAAFGYFFSSFEDVYPFIRTVLGVAQSPIVSMILIPALLFDQRSSGRKI